jgi:hypothetical protein
VSQSQLSLLCTRSELVLLLRRVSECALLSEGGATHKKGRVATPATQGSCNFFR